MRVYATVELRDALVWAAGQADRAAADAKAAGNMQDAADKAGYALELHLMATDVAIGVVNRERLRTPL